MPAEDLNETVTALDKAVFGDRANPRDNPGLIADHAAMRSSLDRTNEILMELRNAVLWINGLLVTGFITGLVALVFKVTF